jgi:hypothetical protein
MVCGAKVLTRKSVSVRTRGLEREYRSVVVPLLYPIDGRGGAAAAKQVDVAMLEGHGIGRVAHANDGDGLVFLRDIVWRVINDYNNKVGIAPVHAPEPVVVVPAEGRWGVEMIAAVEEVDSASLTVVAGEDAYAVLICG